MLRTIDRYVIREVAAPFAIVLIVFTFMLLMDPIMLVADKLIAKGVAWSVVVRVLPTLLPQALSLTIPMALLVGLLIALGRLSEDREWVAMQACGMSVYRLVWPVTLLAVICWLATSYVLIFALPDANQAYREIVIPVVMSRAETEIKPRYFFQDFPGRVLYVSDVRPDGTWRDVFLSDATHPTEPSIYMARKGQMIVNRAAGTVQMVLEQATEHAGAPDKYRVNSFDRSVLMLDPSTVFPREQVVPKGSNEMTIAELQAKIKDLRSRGIPAVDEPMSLQQKFSIPVACLVFAFIGLGLGVSSRKDGKMASFVLGIGVIFVYWVIMYIAQAGAKALIVPPWLARWVPNIVLAPVCFALLFWRGRFSERKRLRLPALWRRRADAEASREVAQVAAGAPAAAETSPSEANPAEAGSHAKNGAPGVLVKIRVPHLGLPRLRILDWYVAKLYARIVALTFGGLLLLFYIAEFIDLSDKLFKGRAKPGMVFVYFLYKTPYFVYFTIPIAILIATLVTLGLLTRSSELVVMKACGISLYRAALPLVLLSMLAGGLLFFLEENILATANRRWRTLNLIFRGINTPQADMLNRGWVISRDGNTIYHYEWFNPPGKTGAAGIGQLSTYTFDPARWRLTARSYATRAIYSPASRRWTEADGWTRQFAADNTGTFAAFRQRQVSLEQPDYFGNEAPDADRMNYFDLKRYINQLSAGGVNVVEQSVRLQQKLAFPFVALVMTLIAVPFAVTMGRRGAMYGIGLGVVLAVGYWITSEVFVAFGKGGLLSPVLAAWAPNILYGASAVYLLLTVRT